MVFEPGPSGVFKVEEHLPQCFLVVPAIKQPDPFDLLQPVFGIFRGLAHEMMAAPWVAEELREDW